jgi:hypothetical protein
MPGDDFDDEIDAALEAEGLDAGKGPATPPPQAVGERLEEMGRERAPYQTPEMLRRQALERDVSQTSALRDAAVALGMFDHRSPEARRTRERISQVWDQLTSGDASLGGRSPTAPIEGTDERPNAGITAAVDTLTLGAVPAIAGRREQVRRAREQAPATSLVGTVAGGLPWMALPGGGSTTLGRAAVAGGQGLGLGTVAGAFHSEGETPHEIAADAVTSGALSGVMGAGGSLAGDALGAVANPRAWRQSADRAQEFADQARLEASGFWGQRAAREVDAHGGPARVAEDLRRLRVGQSQGQWFPTMARAADDLDVIGQQGGERIGDIARTMDARGARVDTGAITRRADELASAVERPGLGVGRRAAERLREEVAEVAPESSFEDALRLRQQLGAQASFGGRPGADAVAIEAGPQFRTLYGTARDGLRDATATQGLGRQWDEANRMSELGHISDDVGAGHRRLSTQGGVGGATSSGDLWADAVRSGRLSDMVLAVPRTLLARRGSQEVRMLAPGVTARVSEAGAGFRRDIARRLYEDAQRGGLISRLTGPSARALLTAASRGQAAFSTALYVAAQRDPEVRALIDEYDMQVMREEDDR